MIFFLNSSEDSHYLRLYSKGNWRWATFWQRPKAATHLFSWQVQSAHSLSSSEWKLHGWDYVTHRLRHDHHGGVLDPGTTRIFQAHQRGLLHEGFSKVDRRFGRSSQFGVFLAGFGRQVIGNDAQRSLWTNPGKKRIEASSLA